MKSPGLQQSQQFCEAVLNRITVEAHGNVGFQICNQKYSTNANFDKINVIDENSGNHQSSKFIS